MVADAKMREFLWAVGKRIKARRIALGLSQERLAEQVDLSPTYIAKLEGGHSSPSLGTVLSIAVALGVDTADLVRLREEDRIEQARNVETVFAALSPADSELMLYLATYLRRRHG